ncbi:CASP-like protein [Zostera marina]|uniref:CASP-like protein n=1 Tax=Zostera marina TaxID=29655 RepID=A0A0K9PL57_ZOSMR|nr:CASP-like protein [Zostera marina]
MDSKDTEMSLPPRPNTTVPTKTKLFKLDFFMRLSVFLSSIVGIILLLTSQQTGVIATDSNNQPIYLTAKFTDSSSLIYVTTMLSVTLVSSMFTTGLAVLYRRKLSPKILLLLIITDMLTVGIMANALGAAGQETYTGLKNNPKFCSGFNKYCNNLIGTLLGTLITSITLMILVVVSSYSLLKRWLRLSDTWLIGFSDVAGDIQNAGEKSLDGINLGTGDGPEQLNNPEPGPKEVRPKRRRVQPDRFKDYQMG